MRSIIHSAAGSLAVVENDNGKVIEILLAKRKDTTSFFPGYHVLPGGVIDPQDVELAKTINGLQVPRDGGFSEAAYRIAFIREFFEEVGILITKKGLLHGSQAQSLQEALTRDRITFSEVLTELDLTSSDLPLQELLYIGSRLRPPFVKQTYLARYYLLPILPREKVEPSINASEIESARWYRPFDVLKSYDHLKIKLPLPTLQQMRFLAQYPLKEAVQMLRDVRKEKYGIDFPVELRPDVEAIPLFSSTLPPHQTTNMVILGGKACFLVDPSPSTHDSRDHMLEVVARLKKERKSIKGIFLTHHHLDHVEGASLLKERLAIPVIAHRSTAAHLPDLVDVELANESWFTAKDARGNDLELKVVFTPGHTEGSISIIVPSRRVAVVGDLMAGFGTVIINPPEGDLKKYLASLRRLQQFELDMIIPGHGPFILNPFERIDEYIRHRMERHGSIRKALQEGASTVNEIVKRVYVDVPEHFHFMAARSVMAHLIMLHQDGEIDKDTLDAFLQEERHVIDG